MLVSVILAHYVSLSRFADVRGKDAVVLKKHVRGRREPGQIVNMY